MSYSLPSSRRFPCCQPLVGFGSCTTHRSSHVEVCKKESFKSHTNIYISPNRDSIHDVARFQLHILSLSLFFGVSEAFCNIFPTRECSHTQRSLVGRGRIALGHWVSCFLRFFESSFFACWFLFSCCCFSCGSSCEFSSYFYLVVVVSRPCRVTLTHTQHRRGGFF